MRSSTITFEIPESKLTPLVTELREAIKSDCGTEYPESAIRKSVIEWLDTRLDTFVEDAIERLSSPSYEDARDFARMLDSVQTAPAREFVPTVVSERVVPNVFSGYRSFSLEKMAAMISFISERTSDLYKTKLNKLLFYADFVNFYLYGNSISGSRYVHLPYGPVPDGYEDTLETLNHYGVIDVIRRDGSDLITSGEKSAGDLLSDDERQALTWVVDTYGSQSASQLTEISHREKAYKDTRTGEEIAYEYAKFMAKLPLKMV